MYRFLFRPRWIAFHLLVALAITTMVNLGFWQLDRLDQREAFNASVVALYDAPVRPLDEVLVLAGEAVTDVEWQPVVVSGIYLNDETIRVVNRSQRGIAGDNIVTPLQLAGGRVLLVNRGFSPLDAFVPAPPPGEILVTGRVHASQIRHTGQLADRPEGDLLEVQRIDIDRIAPQLPGEVVPVYMDLISSDPTESDNAPTPIVAPALTEGNHLAYTVQWFTFALCVAAGWIIAIRRSARARRYSNGAPDPGEALC